MQTRLFSLNTTDVGSQVRILLYLYHSQNCVRREMEAVHSENAWPVSGTTQVDVFATARLVEQACPPHHQIA